MRNYKLFGYKPLMKQLFLNENVFSVALATTVPAAVKLL